MKFMDDCLFCKIIKGEIPSYTIYEDDLVKVFLDINPSTNGDALLIPKKHIVTVDDLDEELLLHLFKVTLKIKKLMEEKLHIEGLTICQNNGHGQDIKHFHIHLTPRYLNDNVKHDFNKEVLQDLAKIHEQLTH